jgi:Glycosyl hydrolase family 26
MRCRQYSFSLLTLVVGGMLATMAATASAGAVGSTVARLSFGVHLPGTPEQGTASLVQLERTLRRKITIVQWYQQWDGAERGANVAWLDAVVASGRTPLVTWEPWAPPAGSVPKPGKTANQPAFRLQRIVAGAYDDYILSFARTLAAWGKPVYLRPMHEMNGSWYPWGGAVNGNSPLEFQRAWRHLHALFAKAGATNVHWVFCVYAQDVPTSNHFEHYYPGARYVDVLALDGYNWGSLVPQYGGWRSFDQLFHSAYLRLARLGSQPIWITEVASADEGGSKAAWIRDMFHVAGGPRYPRLQALVWFDVKKERDWRATSSSSATAAFAAADA